MLYVAEFDDERTLKVWAGVEKADKPFLIQPWHPNGRHWFDEEDAIAWARETYGEPEITIEEPVAIESTEEGTSEIIEETAE